MIIIQITICTFCNRQTRGTYIQLQYMKAIWSDQKHFVCLLYIQSVEKKYSFFNNSLWFHCLNGELWSIPFETFQFAPIKKAPPKCSKKKSSLLVKKIEVSKIGDWLGRKTKNIPIENSYLSLLHYLHKYESESAVKFPTL